MNTYRICVLCDDPYEAGTYRVHANVHTPKRRTARGIPPDQERRSQIADLLEKGHSKAAIARLLGISRQRVHQLAVKP